MSDIKQNAKPAGHKPEGRLKNSEYEKELSRLHVELVKLQLWAVKTGARICVAFEGQRWLREFGQYVEWKSWGVSRP